MIVVVGLTLVEPLADEDANPPGEMEMLVAPVVAQANVLLEPELIVVGLAVNDVMVGLAAAFTVMVTEEVLDPAEFVAVNV